jgi:uracil-DNA glycosylase family 4
MSDPRELLRRYLEQRRELGEREFVLDELSVEDAMRIVGAQRRESRQAASNETPDVRRGDVGQPDVSGPDDWRTTLRAAGAAPAVKKGERPDAQSGIPASTPEVGGQLAPAGIVVGTTSRDLFGSGGPSLDSLDSLSKAIATCTRCPLYATAKNPVPGEGNPDADFMLVGEAPGATEDETGRPFVGQAGQLLEKILSAIRFVREDVFIVNVLKHRPPGNRNPRPEEVSACSPYLVRQIELIRPKVIVALGTFAAQTLLETKLSIGKLRGQIHRYYGVPLIVTYHPAALLRNPAWKRPTWEDVQLARRILDRALGGA